MLMSGSRPLADAVTRSTGTGRLLLGSAAFNAAVLPRCGATGSKRVVRLRCGGRRPAPEVLRITEALADDARAHCMAIRHHQAARGLVMEQDLRKSGYGERIHDPGQHGHDEKQGNCRSDDCIHGKPQTRCVSTRPMSMSLMPTKGTMMPPRP